MRLSKSHFVALVANLALGAIAITDAIVQGTTGDSIIPGSAPDPLTGGLASASLAMALVHGIAYVTIIVVLVNERSRFAETNVFARIMRIALIVTSAAMALAFLVAEPLSIFARIPKQSGFLLEFSNWVTTPAFLGTFVFAAALGFALIRRNPLGVGSRVLLGVVPALLLLIVVGIAAPRWAHPGLVEVVTGVGLALVGVMPTSASTTAKPQPKVATQTG
ncbi:Hypotetical protein [Gulosibacter molinativorax]|nr:Hypotetical protein [Gulosibacter molinativorax]